MNDNDPSGETARAGAGDAFQTPDADSPAARGDASDDCLPEEESETTDASVAAQEGAGEGEDTDEETPWWDDPSLPWRHRPTRSDLACWAWIMIVAAYTFALMPLRAVLIGWSPPIAAMISGGRTSVVATGAWVHVNGGPSWADGTVLAHFPWLVLYWLVASVSLVKFSWVYWWAGRLWGTNIIQMWSGTSERSKKRADRAIRVTNRFAVVAIFLTFLPIPFPMAVVFAALGAAKMPLRRFLPPVLVISGIFQAGYLALGWWIGEPAVAVVNLYAKYMWYVFIVMVVAMIVAAVWRTRKPKPES